MDRRAKVELYEQIRREEHEHGGGMIRGIAKKLGISQGMARAAVVSAVPVKRKNTGTRETEARTGEGLCRCGTGRGQDVAPEAAVHGASDLVSNRGADA